MKMTKPWLAFAFLGLFGSALVGALPPVETPEAAVSSAPDRSAAAECEASFFSPAWLEAATCGSCSDTACRGLTVGTACGYASGQWKTCQDTGVCPVNGVICKCRFAPADP